MIIRREIFRIFLNLLFVVMVILSISLPPYSPSPNGEGAGG